jgi:hypothetical protein
LSQNALSQSKSISSRQPLMPYNDSRNNVAANNVALDNQMGPSQSQSELIKSFASLYAADSDMLNKQPPKNDYIIVI